MLTTSCSDGVTEWWMSTRRSRPEGQPEKKRASTWGDNYTALARTAGMHCCDPGQPPAHNRSGGDKITRCVEGKGICSGSHPSQMFYCVAIREQSPLFNLISKICVINILIDSFFFSRQARPFIALLLLQSDTMHFCFYKKLTKENKCAPELRFIAQNVTCSIFCLTCLYVCYTPQHCVFCAKHSLQVKSPVSLFVLMKRCLCVPGCRVHRVLEAPRGHRGSSNCIHGAEELKIVSQPRAACQRWDGPHLFVTGADKQHSALTKHWLDWLHSKEHRSSC